MYRLPPHSISWQVCFFVHHKKTFVLLSVLEKLFLGIIAVHVLYYYTCTQKVYC